MFKEFDLITKKREAKLLDMAKYLPEQVYVSAIEGYRKFEKSGEPPEISWMSFFINEIGKHYSKKLSGFSLLSLVEFGLHKDKFLARRIDINHSTQSNRSVFNEAGRFALPNFQYDYPLEKEHARKLVSIIFDYFYQCDLPICNENLDHHDMSKYTQVDTYTKSLLKNFINDYAHRSCLSGKELELYGFEAYPGILYATNRDCLVMIAFKPVNAFFIDESICDLENVFDISVGFFSNTSDVYNFEYETLASFFRSYSLLLHQKELEKNIRDSIGESSLISRYWYTDGLKSITDRQDELNKEADSFAFSRTFVEQILAAKIDGVKNVQTYPFDRCFIFKDSALIDKRENGEYSENDSVTICACEAMLFKKSISENEEIKAQDNYVYEWDRFSCNIKDFDIDYTKKHIIFNQWKLDRKERAKLDHGVRNKLHAFQENEASCVDFMIYNLISHKAKKRQLLELEKECFTSEDGICYMYIKNVDLENMPTLNYFQKKYWKEVYNKDKNICKFIEKVDTRNSKVVFISYDPAKAKMKNGIKIDQKHAFTMVIIVNQDIQKNIMEINSEKEGLKTALKLIVRQKTEAAELIKMERENQKNFISNQLKVAMHGIKGRINDTYVKSELDRVIRDFSRKIKGDSLELKRIYFNQNTHEERMKQFLSTLVENTFDFDSGKSWDEVVRVAIQESVSSYCVKGKNGEILINANIYESYLPNFEILIDEITLQEAFHVIIKNAVEEAETTNDKFFSMQMNLGNIEGDSGILNIQVVNSCNPITKERLDDMNTTEDIVALNHNKSGSTGVGVGSSRRQLLSRFGEDAKIKYCMIAKNKILTSLTMPIKLREEQTLFAEDEVVSNKKTVYEIIYLEDEEANFESSCAFLSTHFPKTFIHHANTEDLKPYIYGAKVLFADINVPKHKNGDPKRTYGMKAIKAFMDANENGVTFVLSNEESTQLLESLNERGFEGSISTDLSDIKSGHVYLPSNVKSIEQLFKDYPEIENFLKPLEVDTVKEKGNTILPQSIEISEWSSLSELNCNIKKLTSGNVEPLYYMKVMELDELKKVFQIWHKSEIYIEEDEEREAISNPDIVKTLLILQSGKSLSCSILDEVLFGLKYNVLFLPKHEEEIYKKCIDIIYNYNGKISLKSNGILSSLNHDLAKYNSERIKSLRSKVMSLNIYNNIKIRKPTDFLNENTEEKLEDFSLIQEVKNNLEIHATNHKDALLEKHINNLRFYIDICKVLKGEG
ncbi:hypothetical protein RBH29_13335 [Herbivorax sp. ANBcel31]|uniref:hypothetical protein n=1 Tax=Herbivorax sp. ANBcel31 TaxID=3069754 RepID=UPI0027ADCF85|nr:hypothetical protein [Herbivorax sp. ANBcel31]MDQ2087409.1 hypothetical protein [Herbivorax sp. ANBcel31]